MAAKSKGLQFLEKLQEFKYRQLGRLQEYETMGPLGDTELDHRIIDEILKKRSALMSPEEIEELRVYLIKEIEGVKNMELPTRYEEPGTYSLMLGLAEQIEQAATELGRAIPIRPQIGTLPTGQVNAMSIRVPASDEYLIIFESDLFTFALLLSKVVARVMPFKGVNDGRLEFSTADEDWEKQLLENSEIQRRFEEVVLAYLVEGRPSAAPPYIPEEPFGSLAGILRDSMELFVMAHEYGHIISGHLSQGPEKHIEIDHEEGSEIVRNWQQEFEADAQGLELMVRAMQNRGLDLALSYWGADLFFTCLEIVEQGLWILRTGEENEDEFASASTTHPPPQLRRERLRKTLQSSLPEDQAMGPLRLGMALEKMADTLWQRAKPTLRRCYDAGIPPSPIWGEA